MSIKMAEKKAPLVLGVEIFSLMAIATHFSIPSIARFDLLIGGTADEIWYQLLCQLKSMKCQTLNHPNKRMEHDGTYKYIEKF